jgi:hypothetical protein
MYLLRYFKSCVLILSYWTSIITILWYDMIWYDISYNRILNHTIEQIVWNECNKSNIFINIF